MSGPGSNRQNRDRARANGDVTEVHLERFGVLQSIEIEFDRVNPCRQAHTSDPDRTGKQMPGSRVRPFRGSVSKVSHQADQESRGVMLFLRCFLGGLNHELLPGRSRNGLRDDTHDDIVVGRHCR